VKRFLTGVNMQENSHIYGPDSSQEELYEKSIAHLVDDFSNGYNATIFAYGQTGSGKTYTMGTVLDSSLAPEKQGIIPRIIRSIFDGIARMEEVQAR